MQTQFTIPTDNVYKFYAPFGLVVMLTTVIMFFVRAEYYNAGAFDRYSPIQTLKSKKTLSDDEKLQLFILEKKEAISHSNQKLELGIYFFLFFFFGVSLTVFGFYQWHTKIQPKQDKLLYLEIQKAQKELDKLDNLSR
jgi:hypothetical protein